MKMKMKHRMLSLFFALCFLVSASLFCTTAFAAGGTQDGIVAELTTNKAEYVAGETVNVTLIVKNGNSRVNDIRTELAIPEGVELSTGTLVSDGVDLLPNTEATYSYVLTADEAPIDPTDPNPSNPTDPNPSDPTDPTPTDPTDSNPSNPTDPNPSNPTDPNPSDPMGTNPTEPSESLPAETTPSDGDESPKTGDRARLLIWGVSAIISVVALIVLMGTKKIFKQKWFVLLLCSALVFGVGAPAAVSAAVAEKTFEVVETVTINGKTAEIKAIVTYNLNEESLYTEEVAFKQNGQFLWDKDVEMSYYVPSDVVIDGKTTSKDGTYRPEVTASYIDMLFGCTSNMTGAYVSGEFAKNIFNETAEQTALIGLTDDPASKQALELIDKNEWIITVIDGKLVVTGWYDNASAAAARALYALGSVDADDITLSLPMIGKMDDVDVEMPSFTAGNFIGGMDSDGGAIVLRYNEIEAADFENYCDKLVAEGYELYESNTMNGFKNTATLQFATYVKGDDAILVQYLPVSLLDQERDSLTDNEKKAFDASFRPEGDSIRLILTSAEILINNDAANTGWSDMGITPKLHMVNVGGLETGYASGQCTIFTLADGSFVVVDGGYEYDAEQVYRTLKSLNERPDGEIVVAAWILTHDHIDHIGAIKVLSESEWADEITIEQVVMNEHASSYLWRVINAPFSQWTVEYTGYFDTVDEIISKFAQGENFKRVMPHMGQIMKIRNAELEFLSVGDEDIYPVHLYDHNSVSLMFRVTFPETTDQAIMIEGDSAKDQTYGVYFPLMTGELYADILQVGHHGIGGQSSRLYKLYTGVDTIFYPTNANTFYNHLQMDKGDFYMALMKEGTGTAELCLVCEEYVQTIELPYDVRNDHVLRSKIGTYKLENADGSAKISMLPAYAFNGKWADEKDTIVAYLKNNTADLMILPLVDQNAAEYNKADLVAELYEALDYNFVYYAPVAGNSADGTIGHLILSTYPILKSETGILTEGTSGYAHVLLDVEKELLDLVVTDFANADDWTKFADEYDQWGDYTAIAGDTKIGGDKTQASVELASSAFASDITIFGSENIRFIQSATNDDLADSTSEFYVDAEMAPIYTTTLVTSKPLNLDVADPNPDALDVVVLGTNAFGGKYLANASAIHQTLIDTGADVLTLMNVDKDFPNRNNMDVPAALADALKDVYPYSHYCICREYDEGGSSCHVVLSKYEILDSDTIDLSPSVAENEDRDFARVKLSVDGETVDVFFGNMLNEDAWDELAPAVIASKADNWIATGNLGFVCTKNSVEAKLNQTIVQDPKGIYGQYWSIICSADGKINDFAVTDMSNRIPNADPMRQAAIVFGETEQEDPVETVETSLNAAAINVGLFRDGSTPIYAAKEEAICQAFTDTGADVLMLLAVDKNAPSLNNLDIPAELADALKDIYPYTHYSIMKNYDAGGSNGIMILSKYPIVDTGTIDLQATATDGDRDFAFATVNVDGVTVDVLCGNMVNEDRWSDLAPTLKNSDADAWIVAGNLGFNVTKESVEAVLGEAIVEDSVGIAQSYGNIITSANGIFDSFSTKSLTDIIGRSEAMRQADLTFVTEKKPSVVEPEVPGEPEEPETVETSLNAVMIPANLFGGGYADNADTIHATLRDLDADVLMLINVDKNVTDAADGNGIDVPSALVASLGDLYPYTYYDMMCTYGNGEYGNMILSKYAILDSETIVLREEETLNNEEGISFIRTLVDVDGVKVDVFCGAMLFEDFWEELAPYVAGTEGDAWVMGANIGFNGCDKSDIEAYLGQSIQDPHNCCEQYFSIISSDNGAFEYYVAADLSGLIPGSSATHQADLVFTTEKQTIETAETKLNVAVMNAGLFRNANRQPIYAANEEVICQAFTDTGADVLMLLAVDKNAPSLNNLDIPAELADTLKDVYPYTHYSVMKNYDAGGSNGIMILSKYPIVDTGTIDLQATATDGDRDFAFATVNVDGVTVDVLCGNMVNEDRWSDLAPTLKNSDADAWIVAGNLGVSVTKEGVETTLGETIVQDLDGIYGNYWSIVTSVNAVFDSFNKVSLQNVIGFSDPMRQADLTFTIN